MLTLHCSKADSNGCALRHIPVEELYRPARERPDRPEAPLLDGTQFVLVDQQSTDDHGDLQLVRRCYPSVLG